MDEVTTTSRIWRFDDRTYSLRVPSTVYCVREAHAVPGLSPHVQFIYQFRYTFYKNF
ncbi:MULTISPECIES: hypothetical protein [Nostocales]|uniref:Uncharacterized protein n=3 Tax=Nostocales TaxID=1161 RepID=A0A8S9SZE2_9CYAN|nr:hypothetical protein [Tolypothrix bouteillei]KAF3884784.1 hypothetical protein DA73_0400004455 [Tolypothrix bouteillei VB521301]